MRTTIVVIAGLLAASCSSDDTTTTGTGGAAGNAGASGAAGSSGSGGAAAGSGGNAGASAGAAGSSGSAGSGGLAGGGGTAGGSGGTGGMADGCASALICDDFEAHAVDAAPGAPWTAETNDHGEVVVSSAKFYSGSKALKVNTDGGDTYQRAYIAASGSPLFPAAESTLWGRMMFYADAAPNDGVHWTMIEAVGPVSGQSYSANVRYGGQQQGRLMANYYTSTASSDCWDHSQTAMPLGEWACMEWHFDAATDTMRFYLEGTEISDMTVTATGEGCLGANTWDFPAFDQAFVGWESYQTDPAREVWIDDVALGTERIGCPP